MLKIMRIFWDKPIDTKLNSIYILKNIKNVGFKIPTENIFFGFKKRNFSNTKLKQHFSFNPKYDLQTTLKDFWQGFIKY